MTELAFLPAKEGSYFKLKKAEPSGSAQLWKYYTSNYLERYLSRDEFSSSAVRNYVGKKARLIQKQLCSSSQRYARRGLGVGEAAAFSLVFATSKQQQVCFLPVVCAWGMGL